MCKWNNPAKKAAEFFDRKTPLKDDERIPLSAWLGIALFAFVLYVMMHVGAVVGF